MPGPSLHAPPSLPLGAPLGAACTHEFVEASRLFRLPAVDALSSAVGLTHRNFVHLC